MKNKTIPTNTTIKCLNCGTEFEGKFCPECGQSAKTGRFTMRFIFENLMEAILSKGWWHRIYHQKPVYPPGRDDGRNP